MKKVLMLAVFALTAITTQVNAQKFAVKGGVNFSNMSTTTEGELGFVDDDRKFLTGWNVGLATGINFHENFGFEAELMFNQKGRKHENSLGSTKTKLVYLDIPVSAKGMYNITDGVQIYGKFGPYVGIGLTGKHVMEDADGNTISEIDVQWNDEEKKVSSIGDLASLIAPNYNRFDYGLQMGLGTEIGGFLIEGVYKFSLGDIDTIEATKTKNHVIGISVGYNLDFSKF